MGFIKSFNIWLFGCWTVKDQNLWQKTVACPSQQIHPHILGSETSWNSIHWGSQKPTSKGCLEKGPVSMVQTRTPILTNTEIITICLLKKMCCPACKGQSKLSSSIAPNCWHWFFLVQNINGIPMRFDVVKILCSNCLPRWLERIW